MGDDLRVHISPRHPGAPDRVRRHRLSAAVARWPRHRLPRHDLRRRRPFLQSAASTAHELVFNGRPLSRGHRVERGDVVVFTHDPKFDEPALIRALRTGAGYIGALGSRTAQERRRERLRRRA
jgi:xanthine dehydrogenase accessory factor